MGHNYNQNRTEKKPDILPIPDAYEGKLNNPTSNFSLYSPRMVKWKKDGQDLKSNTDTMEKQKEFFNKNKKDFSVFLEKKQKLQSAYIDELKSLGLQTFSIKAKTVSPFITGLGSGHPTETGMILDRNIGVPYIPASSIKGVLRLAHAINIAIKEKNNEIDDNHKELEKYFGTADPKKEKQYKGQLIFLDAYPVGNVQLKVDIMNPHYTDYYDGTNKQPVETESPKPIKFLTVKEGTEFIFNCAFMPLKPEEKCDEQEIKAMFKTAFETVGFGGKTSIGYGRFNVEGETDCSQNQPIIKKAEPEVKKNLEPGEYEAVVVDFNKNGKNINGIIFSITLASGTYSAIKNKGCKAGDNTRYPKKSKVIIKLDGTTNNQGNYNVVEIIGK